MLYLEERHEALEGVVDECVTRVRQNGADLDWWPFNQFLEETHRVAGDADEPVTFECFKLTWIDLWTNLCHSTRPGLTLPSRCPRPSAGQAGSPPRWYPDSRQTQSHAPTESNDWFRELTLIDDTTYKNNHNIISKGDLFETFCFFLLPRSTEYIV